MTTFIESISEDAVPASLRDSLVPKLMRGEVRAKKGEGGL